MKIAIFKKKNGITTKEEQEVKKVSNSTSEEQLCWSCQFAYTDICPKVAYRGKLIIDKYSFITDGYQIIDEKSDVLLRFVVSGCTNFVNDSEPRIITDDKDLSREKQIAELKKIKEFVIKYDSNDKRFAFNSNENSIIRRNKQLVREQK